MPLPTLRSALLASVVGGVLLPTEVSGGMMTVRKFYSGDTADCKAANLKKSAIYEVPGTCTATSDYGGTVKAVKKSCNAGNVLRGLLHGYLLHNHGCLETGERERRMYRRQ
mmetsp:Transcript_104427/g.336570  ORF Transcript_104427/g.336570 Transcript_104427/m.336570 type:complete len:111 (+) Transcript_104427:93-425(+)